MLYETIITYENKEIRFKFPKKYFTGTYTLNEFLKHTKEYNKMSAEEFTSTMSITAEEFEQMETDDIPITQEFLEEFTEQCRLPKKIIKLGIMKNPTSKAQLAEKLYQLRTTRGNKKQSDIAEIIGVSTNTYTGYESGRSEPDLQTLVKIADIYGVSLDYLAGRKY